MTKFLIPVILLVTYLSSSYCFPYIRDRYGFKTKDMELMQRLFESDNHIDYEGLQYLNKWNNFNHLNENGKYNMDMELMQRLFESANHIDYEGLQYLNKWNEFNHLNENAISDPRQHKRCILIIRRRFGCPWRWMRRWRHHRRRHHHHG